MILTHWGRATHKCLSNPTIIGSDNSLSPSRRQAIIWTNAGILLIPPLGTNFSKILIEIHIISFKKMHFNWSSGKWWPFCPGLNVFTHSGWVMYMCIDELDQAITWNNDDILLITPTLGSKSQWNFNQSTYKYFHCRKYIIKCLQNGYQLLLAPTS